MVEEVEKRIVQTHALPLVLNKPHFFILLMLHHHLANLLARFLLILFTYLIVLDHTWNPSSSALPASSTAPCSFSPSIASPRFCRSQMVQGYFSIRYALFSFTPLTTLLDLLILIPTLTTVVVYAAWFTSCLFRFLFLLRCCSCIDMPYLISLFFKLLPATPFTHFKYSLSYPGLPF